MLNRRSFLFDGDSYGTHLLEFETAAPGLALYSATFGYEYKAPSPGSCPGRPKNQRPPYESVLDGPCVKHLTHLAAEGD